MDVGGKNSHRLSPIYYTSIAEIKGFRFRLKRSVPHQRNNRENEIARRRPGQHRIHSALIDGANHREVMERSIATRRDIPH